MEPPSSLGDPLASLPCPSLLLQMLLLAAPLSRDFCICFSLLLLSVSSCCLFASSPTSPNSNSLTLSLVIYRSASLLHLPQVRSLHSTPPKRELPPSCSPAWWEQSCSADSSGRSSTASGACCLSHRHPRRHIWLRLLTSSVILIFFFSEYHLYSVPFRLLSAKIPVQASGI